MAMRRNHLFQLLTDDRKEYISIPFRLLAPERNFFLNQNAVSVAPVIDPVILLPVKACNHSIAFLKKAQHFFKLLRGLRGAKVGI